MKVKKAVGGGGPARLACSCSCLLVRVYVCICNGHVGACTMSCMLAGAMLARAHVCMQGYATHNACLSRGCLLGKRSPSGSSR